VSLYKDWPQIRTAYSTTHTTRSRAEKAMNTVRRRRAVGAALDSCSPDHPPGSRLTFHSANTCAGRASGRVPTLHSIITSQHPSIIRNNINAYRGCLVMWHAWKGSGGGVIGQAQSMINFHLEAPKLSRWQLSIAVSTGVLYQQISIKKRQKNSGINIRIVLFIIRCLRYRKDSEVELN